MAIKNKHLNASDYWKLPKKRKDKVSPFVDYVPDQVVRSAHYYKWFGLYGLKAKDSLSQYGIAARCLDLEKFEYECYAPDPDEDDCSIYFITTEDYIEEHLQKSPQLFLFFKDTNVSLREFKLMEITDKLHLICNNFDIINFLELDIDECFERDSIILDDLPSYESNNLHEEENVAKQEVKTEGYGIGNSLGLSVDKYKDEKDKTEIEPNLSKNRCVDVENYSKACADYSYNEDLTDEYLEDGKGVLYSKDKKALVSKGNFDGYVYSVRYGTKYIADNAWEKDYDGEEKEYPIEIHFPDTLITIGHSAFSNNKLGDVVMPKSLKAILNDAFSSCSFSSLTLNEGLEYIGDGAFLYSEIDNITIPPTIKYIGGGAFSPGVQITNKSKKISVGTHFICDKDRKRLICCLSKKEKLVLPNTIECVEHMAFMGNHYLQDIYLGKSLRVIDDSAFALCTQLKNVIFPDTLEIIKDRAFWDCFGLTSITLPDNLETIGNSVFKDCSHLTMVVIPSSVKQIGANIFSGCTELSRVICHSPYFEVENDALYDLKRKTLISYFGIDKRFKVREGTKIIGENAFNGNESIENVLLPESLVSIEQSAFCGCNNLKELRIPNTVCNIGFAAIDKAKLKVIRLPQSLQYNEKGWFRPIVGEKKIIVEVPFEAFDSSIPFLKNVENSTIKIPKGTKQIYISKIKEWFNGLKEDDSEECNVGDFINSVKESLTLRI